MPTHQYRQSKRPFLFKPNYLALVLGVLIATPIYAQSLSYAEAEQQALKSSYSTLPSITTSLSVRSRSGKRFRTPQS